MIRIHNDATSDLIKIRTSDPIAFSRLIAFLEQLQADPGLVLRLLEHKFGNDRSEPISVMKWLDVQKREKLPVWRVKSWDLERSGLRYRLIYCYNWPDQTYNVMAIVHRDELDYDNPAHPIRQRIAGRVRRDFPRA